MVLIKTKNPFITALAFIANEFFVFSTIAMKVAIMDNVDMGIRSTISGAFSSLISILGVMGVIFGSILYSIQPELPFIVTGITWMMMSLIIYVKFIS